ncbi:hypothetical protein Ahy_A03g013856 [Arachis hypogaea]|uniref:Uncharacterized protein n=1 Tax=Arachis hypogaea TaxID=3818 RepID=A0A445DWC7_ARAHY|nr:hypothetical protein Ahy_A03g013856 [Arachis hypogaea]
MIINCTREDKNRKANGNWVASKLVKKVRKYPNFRYCDATTFLKTKYDLSLNKNSISMALSDARNVIYGNKKAQYALVREYDLTLFKTNLSFTVQIYTHPQANSEVIFEKMYVYLNRYKNGFKTGCHPLIELNGVFLKTVKSYQVLDRMQPSYICYYMGNCGDRKQGEIEVLNFNKKWKDLELKGLLRDCVQTTTYQDFKEHMDNIKREVLTRSQSNHRPKLDSICNNTCEVFNSKIKEARGS